MADYLRRQATNHPTHRLRPGTLIFIALVVFGCASGGSKQRLPTGPPPLNDESFKDYWFDGTAEISRYELTQNRYGEPRSGDAVLIFVSEDFDIDGQVKTDRADSNSVPVLKMNFVKKFLTGIYPYSIMTSVFAPMDIESHPKALKTTTSVQEWCGQTFLQWNLHDQEYEGFGYSYFQSDGDNRYSVAGALLEDDLWTRIRLQPNDLPTGIFKMLPGSQAIRLLHLKPRARQAEGILEEAGDLRVYTVRYRDEGRVLSIRFGAAFPHRIESWQETVRGEVTEAKRTHTQKLDYWSHHANEDLGLREQLGLPR